MAIQQYLDLITSEHADKPNFTAWLSAALNKVNDGINASNSIASAFDITTAVGTQLDTLGQVIGQLRNIGVPLTGTSSILDDTYYRMVLQAKIARNSWDGRIDQIYSIWNNAFPDSPLQIIDNQDMTMQAIVSSLTDTIATELVTAGFIIPKPMGVTLVIIAQDFISSQQYIGAIVSGGDETTITSMQPTGTSNLVSNPGAELVTQTKQVFSDALTSYTGSTVPAPWTATGGTFTFGASGVTINSKGTITTGNSSWKPIVGSDGSTKLSVTAQATFTTPATIPASDWDFADVHLRQTGASGYEYIARIDTTDGFSLVKNVPGTSSTLTNVSSFTPTASTQYTITLSLDPSGNLTAALYSGGSAIGTPLETLVHLDSSPLTGGFLIGVGGDTGVIISNASVTAPWANGWTIGGDSRVAWALNSSSPISGKYSPCAVGVANSVLGYAETGYIPITPSATYMASAYMNTQNVGGNGTTGAYGAWISWWDSNKTHIATNDGSAVNGTTSTQRVSTTQTLPSNAAFIIENLVIDDAGTVTFDEVSLVKAS